MTDDQIIQDLQDQYGAKITSGEVKAYCQMNDLSYPTVTRRLENFKVGRGKWDLTVKEKLEQSFQAPAALPAVDKTLFLRKMIPSSSLAILVTLKKLLNPVSSTLRLSRVSRVMVKRFLLNKRVPNSDEN